MYCKHCGNQINENDIFCDKCGTPIEQSARPTSTDRSLPGTSNTSAQAPQGKPVPYFMEKKKCLPAFIIGLIGSIFGLFGGLCTTMCSCGSSSNSAFVMIFLGSVIGMIGTCLCLSKCRIGSIMQLLAAIMIIIRAYSGGSDFMTVIAFVFLLISGIIGVIYGFLSDKLAKK